MQLIAELAKNYFSSATEPITILDVGGLDGESYEDIFSAALPCHYHTMNVRFSSDAPQNSTILVENGYNWPEFADESYDMVISGQVLEHVEYFWCSLLEMQRVLKKGGILANIAPSHWQEHRAPFDCYRYYADGFRAMTKFIGLEEIYTFAEQFGMQCDAVSVAKKPHTLPAPDSLYRQAHEALLKILPQKTISEVSRNKAVMQSSHVYQWETREAGVLPGNAVSGLFTGKYSFHTNFEENPWWIVDLGQKYTICLIKVFNRQQFAERAYAMNILVSSDMANWKPVYSDNQPFGGCYDGKPLVCTVHNITAKYVMLHLREPNFLHLDQVQVFAEI